MKIAIIQSGNNGFFPNFYNNLGSVLKENGYNFALFSPRTGMNYRRQLNDQIFWGGRLNWHIHNFLYKITGIKDVYSTLDTLDLIIKLSKYKPDIIHLNVIGEAILNIPILTRYIAMKNIPIVWTMHDCRAFTGGCPYFDEVGCDKWKNGCGRCPDKQYRSSKIDGTRLQWNIMKKSLKSLKNLTIVTPSLWLHDFVKQSFLKEYDCKIIYNGINQTPFINADGYIIRNSLGLNNKKIILGVAASWTTRKGLDSFKFLASMLPEEYQIVLVGAISEDIPKVIKLPPTSNVNLMASYYKMADVFCNPTLADNFPTTNIEALSAGTPVVTYRTGGSPEAIDSKSGIVVEKGDKQSLAEAIVRICSSANEYSIDSCLERSKKFGVSQYNEYIALYKNILRTKQ